MSSYFLLYLALLVSGVGALAGRYLSRHDTRVLFLVLPAWLVYVGALGYFGIVGEPNLRPPGTFFLMLPVFLFVAFFLARSPTALLVAQRIPLAWLTAAQVFRVGVELFLHQLVASGLAPRLLSFAGGNVDILIGLSAPLLAWLAATRRMGARVLLLWNWVGLASLLNVALRALLSAPGPWQLPISATPNLMLGTFPYTFIPGFMAPLALVLHVLSIRVLRARLRDAVASGGD